MKISKKQCVHCKDWFLPDRRIGKRQRRCFKEECRRASNRQKARSWTKRHPKEKAERKIKTRAWAYAYPRYWRHYRRTHPAYCLRDNARRTTALRKSRRSAKLTSIRQTAVGKLRRIEDLTPTDCSAKLTSMDRRVDGIMDYLLWTVGVACPQNITHMDFVRSCG